MILLNLLTTAITAASAQPPLVFNDCVFGEVYAFSIVDCRMQVRNATGHAIHIELTPQQAGDSIEPSSLDVAANSSRELRGRIAVANGVGDLTHFFKVQSSDKSIRDQFAKATGFAMTALDEAHPRLDFGSVDLSKNAPSMRIELGSHDAPEFRITRVLESPVSVQAKVLPDQRSLDVKLRSDADWGLVDDFVKVAIDTPHQKEAWVQIKAELHGQISTPSNPVWMGIVPPDAERKILVPLKNSEGKEFQIGKIEWHDIKGDADVVPCEPAARGCKALRVVLSKDQVAGPVRGNMTVQLPDYSKQLSIAIWGVLQALPAKGAAGGSANNATARASDDKSNETVVPAPAPTPPAESSAESAAAAPPAGRGPLLKWSVADDGGVYGYQIFRSDSESGSFVLVNPKTVPAQASRKKGVNTYQWRDETAKAGNTYWYYIGAVGKEGSKRKLSNPQKKVVTD